MPSNLQFLEQTHLHSLLDCHGEGLVSIYAPMVPGSSGVQQNQLRWRTISTQVRQQLSAQNSADASVGEVVSCVDSLGDDKGFWKQQSCGLATFVGANLVHHFRLHAPPEQSVCCESRFNLRNLLPEINRDNRYFIIAKCSESFRFIRVECDSVKELSPPAISEKLSNAIQSRQLQQASSHSDIQESVETDKPADLAKELNAFLFNESKPQLFFAGSQQDYEAFRKYNCYERLNEQRLKLVGDGDSWERVLRESQSVVKREHNDRIEQISNSFRNWKNSDWASDDLPEIYRASVAGQVTNLLVSNEFSCFSDAAGEDKFDFSDYRSTRHECTDHDIVNLLISETLRNGGRVFDVPAKAMPCESDVVALYGETDKLSQ